MVSQVLLSISSRVLSDVMPDIISKKTVDAWGGLSVRLFSQFSQMNIQNLVDSFFLAIRKFIETSEERLGATKLDEAILNLASGKFRIVVQERPGGRVLDESGRVLGKLLDLNFVDEHGEMAFGNDSVIPNVLFLLPASDGYFRAFGRELYSPFVVFDKFSTVEEEQSDELDEFIEDGSDSESSTRRKKIRNLDLENSIVLQGYYLAWLSTLLATFYEKFSHRNTKLSQASHNFNKLAITIGVQYFRYYSLRDDDDDLDWSVRYVWQKIPVFFLPDRNNAIEFLSNPRKVVYPNDQVPDSIRYPHLSHLGIVDLLETPETEKIGLTLTLVDSDDLEYDFEKLRIVNRKLNLEVKRDVNKAIREGRFDFLSLATKQIPFMLHSDAARVLMGSKNIKQAVQVEGAEEPFLKTGAEKEKLGVNALVAYGLFYGYNFEDGIVVSESFAKRMAVRRYEEEKFVVAVENDKKPKVEQGAWVYVGEKKKDQSEKPYAKIRFCVREGETVFFGKPLFEVFRPGSSSPEVHTYPGRYEAKVVKLPAVPPFPYESEYLDGTFVDIVIGFEVFKPLEVGDKLMGRHGNKGTVALVLPDEEMPVALIGGRERTLDVILSPLGVVSRMNLGQLYETHITVAQKFAGFNAIGEVVSPVENVYDKCSQLLQALKSIGADEYGRFPVLYKGRKWQLTVGYQYIVRLDHCVRDKLHVVALASESEFTGQPKKGKSRHGGQRFGELEFWSLYSYGNRELVKLFARKNLSEELLSKYERLNVFPDEMLNRLFEKTYRIRFETSNYMVSRFEYAGIEEARESMGSGISSRLDETLETFLVSSARSFLRASNLVAYKFLTAKLEIKNAMLDEKLKELCTALEQVLGEFSNEPSSLDELRTFAKRTLEILERYDDVVEKLEPGWKNYLKFGNNEMGEVSDRKGKPRLYRGIALTKVLNEIFELKGKTKLLKYYKKLRHKLSFVLMLREENSYLVGKSRKFLARFFLTKDGYIRNLVVARRLHFSGRAVISPLPVTELAYLDVSDFDIDTVAVPVDFGIEWFEGKLEKKVDSSKVKNARKGDLKSRIEVAKVLNKVVEQEDVLVILNRQPSLHRHSLQCFRPIFWENYTIGLPINVCEGFNADFDGDTMAVYLPATQDETIKAELMKMMPSRNPFKLGSGELIYSVDQDMVYGYFLKTGGDKGALKKELGADIRKLASEGDYEQIKTHLRETVVNEYLKLATEENLTLSVFEIISRTESMEKIARSKCRGNQKQYVQLYEKIDTGEGLVIQNGFVAGVPVECYLDPERGVARRARRTLMDKKLRVAEAGYFTRKLVEFLGSIRVSKDSDEYVLHEIRLDEELCDRKMADGKAVKFGSVFGKSRFMYRWLRDESGKVFFADSEDKIPDHFWVYSPKPVQTGKNSYAVSALYCGKDVSKLKDFEDGEFIGVSAGHVLGERGTQLSMETFHTGGRGLSMDRVSSSIFRRAFEASTYQGFLEAIERDFYADMQDSLLEKLNSVSLYFELLYNFAQQLKAEGFMSVNQYFYDFEKRGPLTCLSFERGSEVLENLQLGKDYEESHPRVEYAFFWRCM